MVEEQGLLSLQGVAIVILGLFGLAWIALWPFCAIRNRFRSRRGQAQDEPRVWRQRRQIWVWGGVSWVVCFVLLILFFGRP